MPDQSQAGDGAPRTAVSGNSVFLSCATELATRLPDGVRFGTSSWTYPGWTGLVYERGYPKSGATVRMLAEYARCPLFRTVGVDSFFYRPPSERTMQEYREALPDGFPLVMKVWDRITSYALRSPRYDSPGTNADWMNPSLCTDAVIGPSMEHLGSHAGVFVFEFEAIPRSVRMTAGHFAERLARFLEALPEGPRYAVEIRSPDLLDEPYFEALRAYRAAHVFNSWTRMPSIGEQLLDEHSFTADFTVVRALLRPGRTYSDAVDAFAPYDRIQDEYPEGRRDIVALIEHAFTLDIKPWVIVNNRFEGASPLSIAGIAGMLAKA